MSILSQLIHGKITWAQALTDIEAWAGALLDKAPLPIHDAINAAVKDVKQGASDAIALGDTLAGPLIDTAASAAGIAFKAAVTTYLGPFGATVTPAGLDAIDRIRDGVIAELHVLALQAKAGLAGFDENSAVNPHAPAKVA